MSRLPTWESSWAMTPSSSDRSIVSSRPRVTATEDKIAFARRFYNGNVRDYNTALQTFPTNILAGTFGFKPEQYFELADQADREVPQVKFT